MRHQHHKSVQKLLLIGPGGSGKSALAQRIAARTGLPAIHLDTLFWKPGWCETPRDEWRQMVAKLLEREAWVMDGNYGGTFDQRLAACDSVVFLDMSPALCAWRVLKRRLRFHRKVRPDMGDGCSERLSLDFLLWILNYRRSKRPGILRKLAAASADGKQVFVLDSRAAVDAFMSSLPAAREGNIADRTIA